MSVEPEKKLQNNIQQDFAYQESLPHCLRAEVIKKLIEQSIDDLARHALHNQYKHSITVLDVGIGNGWLTQLYRDIFNILPIPTFICGLDSSEELAGLVKHQNIVPEAIVSDVRNIPVKNGEIDLIILSEILEHVSYPINAPEDASRILRPDGILIGSTPNIGELWDRLRMLKGQPPRQIERHGLEKNFSHCSFFTPWLLEKMLAQVGFENITFFTNLVRLLPGLDDQLPYVSNLLVKIAPKLGDRIIWSAYKKETPDENQDNKLGRIPSLYIVCGPPLSGKSTLASRICKYVEGRLISHTEIRHSLSSNDPHSYPLLSFEASNAAYEKGLEIAIAELKKGRNIVWDATFQSDKARQTFKQLMMTMTSGYKIIVIELTLNKSEIKKRLEERRRNDVNHPDIDVNYERALHLLKTRNPFPGALRYNTTYLKPQQILNLLIQELNL